MNKQASVPISHFWGLLNWSEGSDEPDGSQLIGSRELTKVLRVAPNSATSNQQAAQLSHVPQEGKTSFCLGLT